MSLLNVASGLVLDENGIWVGPEAGSLSYPSDGNAQCYLLEDQSFWFKHRNNCIVSILRQFPPNGPLLDVGGGNGYVTRRLLDEGFDAILCEPGPEGAFNAKIHRHIPQVICATLEDASFKKESIPAVGCFDVIEHIEDDHQFLRQIHDALSPRGRLYATVPVYQWLWSASDDEAGHFRRHTKATIVELLGDDYELEFFSCFFVPLLPFIYFLRSLPYKIGLSRKAGVMSSDAEHGVKRNVIHEIVDFLLHKEVRAMDARKSHRFGASCLFVARKVEVR